MDVVAFIDKKRLGRAHAPADIHAFVSGVMSEAIPDYQVSAWLMAVCCQGMDVPETVALTEAFVQSGTVLDYSDLDGVVVDKHSTGGVGDKTTLVLAPLLASCGVKVAKLSGRGLGYTGGTVDKLEAIPGFQMNRPLAAFRAQLKTLGVALSSQTPELAPADAKFYALRDVTATVASIPLIAASVMSKKIAAGAQVITLDIKAGSGAFMKTVDDARQLAAVCRDIGKACGRKVSTVISDMDEPLGLAIGHTVEVMEAMDTLKGHGPDDLTQLCVELAAISLFDAGVVSSLEAGRAKVQEAIRSGKAIALFRELITAQHGDARVIDQPDLMPMPTQKIAFIATKAGILQHIDALSIAKAGKVLGAGRETKSAAIDLAVGVILHKKHGDTVQIGETLATLWANQKGIEEAKTYLERAFDISPQPSDAKPMISEVVLAEK